MGIRKQIYQSIIMFLIVTVVLVLIVASFVFLLTARSVQNVLAETGLTYAELQSGAVDSALLLETARTRLHVPFLLVAVLTMAAILCAAALFTTALSRRILVPLAKLKTGADHVAAGDITYAISYDSCDEFGIVCGAFDDMTVHLSDTLEKNKQYEQSRKELLAGISHDLRTPLTAIKGYVKGIQDGVASTPEKQQQYLDTIYNKAKDMEVLVEKLFLFSKLDTGKEVFNMAHVSARDYLAGYVQVVQPDMQNKGVRLQCDFALAPQVLLYVDCDQMSRVFTNILENSAKYKRKPMCVMQITARAKGSFVVLRFNDDGPGVPEEALPKLFDSFYRADASRTRPQKGSGLGLAVAERIVTAHGGTIRATNHNGLCITITLPIDDQKEIQA